MASTPSLLRFDSFNMQRLLRRKAVERGVLVIKILFALSILLLIAVLVSEAIDNSLAGRTAVATLDSEVKAATTEVGGKHSRKDAKSDYSRIVKTNLFGPLQQAQTQKTADTPVKPVNKTPLALIGVFLTVGEEPSAIIEDQKKKVQDVFGLGEMVFGEAKLVSVKPDRVEIERLGQREVLALDDTPERSSSAEFKEGVAMISDTEFVVQEAELDKALENLPLLLTQARAVPYFKDGKSVGLRLFAVKPGSLFERIGLKNGDILKTINGNAMGDLSQAVKLFETLKQEKSIAINMERDRSDKEVHYQIR
ncbi:MAG: type II secretion system protein GspC [Deltaproteobacteria bacterium]|nr:type II secretion system protein GspC [Deltaproteobacteria bacterium]